MTVIYIHCNPREMRGKARLRTQKLKVASRQRCLSEAKRNLVFEKLSELGKMVSGRNHAMQKWSQAKRTAK